MGGGMNCKSFMDYQYLYLDSYLRCHQLLALFSPRALLIVSCFESLCAPVDPRSPIGSGGTIHASIISLIALGG